MTTATDLYAAILANPADLDLRLVYADAIEESDPDRCEFIRVQCDLANEPEATHAAAMCAACDRSRTLRRRERELWEDMSRPAWLPDGWWCGLANDPKKWPHGPHVVWRNGFAEEVTCTLADWRGSQCGNCLGRGTVIESVYGFPTEENRCCSCHGTGRIGGHGPAIVGAAPIFRVVVTDREPLRFRPDSGSASFDWPELFAWGREIALSPRVSKSAGYWLPDDFWLLLPCDHERPMHKRYPTASAAHAALSTALIREARQQAGLPEATTHA